MYKRLMVAGIAAFLLTVCACSKQTPPNSGQNTGSINLSSEVAGMVLIDGTKTDKCVKAQDSVFIDHIATGMTEIAVLLDDGTVVKAQETVLIKAGETVMAHIAVSVVMQQETTVQIIEAVPEPAEKVDIPAPVKPTELSKQDTNTTKSYPASIPTTQATAAQPSAVPAQTQAATSSSAASTQAIARPSAVDIKRAEEHKEAGLEYLKKDKNYEKAITAFSEVIMLIPDDADAYYYRGAAYAYTGSHDRALEDIIATFRIEEDYRTIEQFVYGYLDDDFGTGSDYTRAFNVINAAIKIKPNLPDGYIIRGNVYSDKGDNDHAIADFTTALRIKPDKHEALFNRGNVYASKGDYDRAIEDYTAALKIKPDKHEALFNRGNAYRLKGDIDRAIADWETVLQINPNDVEARGYLEMFR